MSEYDLLLLQHVLWQRPEEAQRIADYLLGQLASDSGGQIDMLLQGARERAGISCATCLLMSARL